MGDFNMPDVEWSDDGTPVLFNESSPNLLISDAINNASFVKLVTGFTFINNGNLVSLLDLILVSDPNRVTPIEIGPPLVTCS